MLQEKYQPDLDLANAFYAYETTAGCFDFFQYDLVTIPSSHSNHQVR